MAGRTRICEVADGRNSVATVVGRVGLLKFVTPLVVVCVALAAIGCSSALDEARELESDGDWGGALASYEEILKTDPENLDALSGAAVALCVMQRFDEALGYQEHVVAADPQDAQTRVELGFNYLNHQDRPQDAARVLAEAAVLEPTAKYLTFLAQAREASGELQGAEDALNMAIATDPRYVYAYRQLVTLLEEQGRDSEVTELLDQAQSLGLDVSDLE